MLELLAQIPNRAYTLDEVVSPYIYVFYAAFMVAFVFTPWMRSVALHFNVIDKPDLVRKLHRAPIAYLGGVAVFLGWMAGLAVSQFLKIHREDDPGWTDRSVLIPFSIVIGASIIIVLGLWDDIYTVSPRIKIAGQALAGACLLLDNVGTKVLGPLITPAAIRLCKPFGGFDPTTASWLNWEWVVIAASSAFVIVVVVGACNATNLMDGLDGLAGGVTSVISAGFLFIAINLAQYGGAIAANQDGLRIILALALLGGVLGFLPYNFNPASIFMGDTGSMFLGFCCALLIVLMGSDQHPKWFLASMVIFALPVLDTALAFARRYVNGRPLFSADRFHLHHQLVARGFSVKQTVLIEYGLAIAFGILGCSMLYMRTRFAVAVYMVVFAFILVAAYKMGMVHERSKAVTPSKLGDGPDPAAPPVGLAEGTTSPANTLEIADRKA